jgi:AAA+ ATPase superfamily predicted ATPase
MKISTGHSVEADEFFGRERELGTMAEVMQDKRASIFIPGPRRIGKTSLVKEFILRNQNDYRFVYFDLESRNSIIELCKDLTKAIEKNYPEFIKKSTKLKELWNTVSEMIPTLKVINVEVQTGKISSDVKDFMDNMELLFEELNQLGFVFAFDEFSDFLWNLRKTSIDEVKLFLKWLRTLRQESKIRLIITGSINVMSTVDELNVADLINDLTDIEIFPLTKDEVKSLLRKLTEPVNITFTEDGINAAVEKLSDGIPFFVQLFASGLRTYKDKKNAKAYNAEEINAIYFKITGKQHKEFIDLHSRLKDYLSDSEYQAARKILAHLASDPMTFNDLMPYVTNMVHDKEKLHRLLKRLTDENYITKTDKYYRFVSPMIADWWKNTYDWER